jgi:hypothetical protein
MTNFIKLLTEDLGLSVQEQQEHANREFAERVINSNLHLWKPGDPYPDKGRRTLIGVAASYSIPDLQLLDAVDEKLDRVEYGNDRVDVFNVSDCKTMEDFEGYVPGSGNVYQTPIVGIWEDGILKQRAWGEPARDAIRQLYQLNG